MALHFFGLEVNSVKSPTQTAIRKYFIEKLQKYLTLELYSIVEIFLGDKGDTLKYRLSGT